MRDFYLHGEAGRRFGRHFRLDVATPAEALRALFTLRPASREFVKARFWRVVVGAPHVSNSIGADALGMMAGSMALHLVPATQPRGGDDGIGKIIAGVVLIGASLAFAPITAMGFGLAMAETTIMGMSFGSLALMGASMVLVGVTGLMSQPPAQRYEDQPEQKARPEDRPSFLFNGVTNNSQQGGPVPVVVGRHLVGSVVVSGGIAIEDIAI